MPSWCVVPLRCESRRVVCLSCENGVMRGAPHTTTVVWLEGPAGNFLSLQGRPSTLRPRGHRRWSRRLTVHRGQCDSVAAHVYRAQSMRARRRTSPRFARARLRVFMGAAFSWPAPPWPRGGRPREGYVRGFPKGAKVT